MYNSSINMSKCAATTVCMATGISICGMFLHTWAGKLFSMVCSTYIGWKNYFPRTCARDIFYLRMCDYLFTKILCTYLLFVHTWGVYVHMYLFNLFVSMDLVHHFFNNYNFQFFYSNRLASLLSIR